MTRSPLAMLRMLPDHFWTRKHMHEYVDGELGPDGRKRVERHVDICPWCRRLLATLKRTLSELATLGAEPRPGLADGVVERLRDEP